MLPIAVKLFVRPTAWLLAGCLLASPTFARAAAAVAPPQDPATAAQAVAESAAPDPEVQPRTVTVPAPARLLYDVTARLRGAQLHGDAQLRWQHDGEKYELRLEIRALSLLLRSQTSIGSIGPVGLAPERFVDRTHTERSVEFDRKHRRIVFGGGLPDAPLQPLAQDRLSVTLQLSAMLAGDPAAFARGATLALQTAGPAEAEVWHFSVKGENTLPFSGAELRTLKLERDPRHEGDQKIEIWFAPLLGYLPVRLKITQPEGDFVEQRLRAVEKP